MEKYAHDPSVVMEAAGRVFTEINSEIENSKGQLEKIAGDAIMAYWASKGSPAEAAASAHRACLAALRLQADNKETWRAIIKVWPISGTSSNF